MYILLKYTFLFVICRTWRLTPPNLKLQLRSSAYNTSHSKRTDKKYHTALATTSTDDSNDDVPFDSDAEEEESEYIPKKNEVEKKQSIPSTLQELLEQTSSQQTKPTLGPPPDIPSLLLHNRIIYLGDPLSPPITELLISQLLYLNYQSRQKPIYFYINSTGSETADRKPTVAFESDPLAILDIMNFLKSPIHTVAIGRVQGSAALLLAAGTFGYRYALPNTVIVLRQPESSTEGFVTDVVIQAKQKVKDTQTLLTALSQTTGIQISSFQEAYRAGRYFTPFEAIKFGLIDHIIDRPPDITNGRPVPVDFDY